MTGLVEITDYDSAEAWLETQDHQTRVWFATRCALRAFPTVGLAFRYTTETVTLSLLRSMLISGSASTCLRKDLAKLRKAAASANASGQKVVSSISISTFALQAADNYSSVGEAANSAVSAVASVSDSNLAYVAAKSAAGSVYSDEFPDDSSIHFSAMQRDTENKMLWPGLWHSVAVPNRIPTSWAIVSFLNKADPKNWDFWREWYEGILNGTPLPWDLTFEIATTLTDEDWDAGAAHVADRIRDIRAAWIRKSAGTLEDLVLDPDTHLFSARSIEASNEERLARMLSRIEDAMDDAVTLGGGNGITHDRVEFLILARLIQKYADDPERIAFDLTDMGGSISRQIEIGEYPKDAPMQLLQSAIAVGIAEIREMQPELNEVLDRHFEGTETKPSDEDVLVLTEAMQVSADMMDAPTAATTTEDIEELQHGRIVIAEQSDLASIQANAVALRRSVLRRQISRLGQQYEALCQDSRLAKHYDSATFKTNRVVRFYGGTATVLLTAIGILAGWLGVF